MTDLLYRTNLLVFSVSFECQYPTLYIEHRKSRTKGHKTESYFKAPSHRYLSGRVCTIFVQLQDVVDYLKR